MDQIAWLVEKREDGIPLSYFAPYRNPAIDWTVGNRFEATTWFHVDSNKAIRFSRKEDAAAILKWIKDCYFGLGSNLFVVEHMWVE